MILRYPVALVLRYSYSVVLRVPPVARSSPFEDLSVYMSLLTLDLFTVVN